MNSLKNLLLALAIIAMTSGLAQAMTFRVNEAGYTMEEATGFVRNSTGAYQGPGAGTGLLYGPFATLELDNGFVLAKVLSWHLTASSRVGGDASSEGSKLSLSGGVAPLTIMGVSFVAGYNPIDGAVTWGVSTSLKGLAERLLTPAK